MGGSFVPWVVDVGGVVENVGTRGLSCPPPEIGPFGFIGACLSECFHSCQTNEGDLSASARRVDCFTGSCYSMALMRAQNTIETSHKMDEEENFDRVILRPSISSTDLDGCKGVVIGHWKTYLKFRI